MWFVWDGQRRHGPLSENEICRRIAAGECSLHSWIRGEEDPFYRPTIWLLRGWTLSRSLNFTEQSNVLLESTQIASQVILSSSAYKSSPSIESVSFEPNLSSETLKPEEGPDRIEAEQAGTLSRKPEFPENLNELSRGQQLEFSLKDSLKSIFSGKFSDLKLFSNSGNQSPDESDSGEQEDIENAELAEIGAEDAPIVNEQHINNDELQRPPKESAPPLDVVRRSLSPVSSLSSSRRNSSSSSEVAEAASVNPSRGSVGRNQMPKVASEGVVSLAAKKQQTRARVRRVNPTAPRQPRRRKSHLWTNISRSMSALGVDPFLLKTFLLSSFLSLVGLVSYVYYKKQNSSGYRFAVVNEPVERRDEKVTDPTIRKIREAVSKRNVKPRVVKKKKPKKKEVRKKTMRAKSGISAKQSSSKVNKVKKQLKKDVFSSQSDLKAHLVSSGQGGFIVVGPLKLIQQPPQQCAPCEGRVRLPDGSTLVVRSVIAQPWRELRFQQSFFARGSLVKAKPYFLFLNKVSAQPKF